MVSLRLGECEAETASHICREIMRLIRQGDKHVALRSVLSKVKEGREEGDSAL